VAKKKYKDVDLGPMPVDDINRTLGLELEPGEVVFSAASQRHAESRHEDDFARCLAFVAFAVKEPVYIGDDLRNGGKIELVRRMSTKEGLLVALTIAQDENRRYHVCSMYPISQSTIDKRRAKGFLRIVVRK
jgi:hypothetical protein